MNPELAFHQAVRIRDTTNTRARGIAGHTGHIAGKSREGDHSPVLSYAVYLDRPERVYSIAPDDLEPLTTP